MAFVTPTNPEAAKREAAELRQEAHRLLAQADRLDPPAQDEPKEESKAEAEPKPAKKGKK